MEEIVYFELNNWFCGRHYPDVEPFITWMGDDLNLAFNSEEWVKQNELCVVITQIDMSLNFCVTSTKKWVEENCPTLLKEDNRFLRSPDKHGCVDGSFGTCFLDYNKEKIGIVWEEDDE